MRLLNVRLSGEDSMMVQALREQGVAISQLVCDAIRSEYNHRKQIAKPRDTRAILNSIYAAYPKSLDLPPRGFDVHDRIAFRKAMARHLGRRKRP
jgi:hypothetical protein